MEGNQITLGTPDKDMIVQYGYNGNDTQYAPGAVGGNWLWQEGGSGDDNQTSSGGSDNDVVYQDGGIDEALCPNCTYASSFVNMRSSSSSLYPNTLDKLASRAISALFLKSWTM